MSPDENFPHRRTDGIAREAERREITGIPTTTWYVLQGQGLAPKPVRLGRALSAGCAANSSPSVAKTHRRA